MSFACTHSVDTCHTHTSTSASSSFKCLTPGAGFKFSGWLWIVMILVGLICSLVFSLGAIDFDSSHSQLQLLLPAACFHPSRHLER